MKLSSPIFSLLAAGLLLGCQGRDKHPEGFMPGAPKSAPAYPAAVNVPVKPELQKQARAQIDQALSSNDEIIRAHALETIKDLQLTDAGDAVYAALRDRSPLVRMAAAITVGELKLARCGDRLPELLQSENSAENPTSAQQERMAAIFALHRLGDTQYSHEFEKTAFDARTAVRGQTAFLLGLLGDKSAIPILVKILNTDKDANVRLQAGEALWRMGDERGEDALLAGTISSYASDQMISLLGLAEPRDTRVVGHIEGLFDSDYLEVRLVAARAAGLLGSDHGYGIAAEGAKSVDPRQRTLAAMAFGGIGRADSQTYLAKLLQDSDPDTRLAAAGALLAIGKKQ
jgi:HEAT repeat protein